MQKIVLASANPGKLREFKQLLLPHKFDVCAQSEFNVSSADETGLTFVENALIKARHACDITKLPAIADDSGIEVDALNGEPGIYSARFAGENASDEDNNALLLERLANTPASERTARYQCILVFMQHALDPTPIICHGSWEGRILHEEIGENGFGYDPLFWVEEKKCTAAQLDKDEKNSISHRAKAMIELIEELKNLQSH